ncbi:MAG: lipoate--protein ligase family protein [Planctomycetes bacterium]|nr:lipoate--protein ligase family protein [Planctomycetota bacterium]
MIQSAVEMWPESVDWHDTTLATPALNLALDEVLLHQVEAFPSRAIGRTWEPTETFVVVGRSNRVETEVNVAECQSQKIPIFRRSSGGGAVVVGPGCLAYALALPLTDPIRAAGVSVVTRRVMETIAAELQSCIPEVMVCGTSDLVWKDRKFSGNSQRWLRQAFLHHGTILYDFDLPQIGKLLKPPSRQPDYRSQRSHADFVANVAVSRERLLGCLISAWHGRHVELETQFLEQARSLAGSRYERAEWNLER